MRRWRRVTWCGAAVLALLAVACAHADGGAGRAESPQPFWVFTSTGPEQREAWWVDTNGRVFSVLLKGSERPKPPPDAEPVAWLEPDGTHYASDHTTRVSFVDEKREIRQPGDGMDAPTMHCWLTEPCGLRCTCTGGEGGLSFSARSGVVEPPPRSALECRRAIALLGSIELELDGTRHGDLPSLPW